MTSQALLVGVHDFTAFSVIEPTDPRTPMKHMRLLQVTQTGGPGTPIVIVAECDRFLYHMMRNISGALIQVPLAEVDAGCCFDGGQFNRVLFCCNMWNLF